MLPWLSAAVFRRTFSSRLLLTCRACAARAGAGGWDESDDDDSSGGDDEGPVAVGDECEGGQRRTDGMGAAGAVQWKEWYKRRSTCNNVVLL